MKHQNSYSFFCCFCEESKKNRKNNRQIRNNIIMPNTGHPPNIFNIDTESIISEKIPKKSEISTPRTNHNIIFNEEKIEKKEEIKENEKYELQDIKKIIMNDKESINSYYTTHNNNRNKNFFENDVNSLLVKNKKKDTEIKNLDLFFKKIENDNIKKEENNIKEEEKIDEKTKKEEEQIEKKEEEEEKVQEIKIKNSSNKDISINNLNNKENIIQNNNINNTNNRYINKIQLDPKDNLISKTIKQINRLDFEESLSQEKLLFKNRSNLNKSINSNLIKFIDISNNNISLNKEENPNTNRDTNPINKINLNLNISKDNDDNNMTKEDELIINKNESKKDYKTTVQKQNKNLNLNFSFNKEASTNSELDLRTNINKIENIKINLSNLLKSNEKEEKIEEKEITLTALNKETMNNININIETQTQKENIETNTNNNINTNTHNNTNEIKLNYLTDFNPTKENQNTKEIEDNSKKNKNSVTTEEMEDEVGSIDEFNNTNDNRSVISSYIFDSVRPTETTKSYSSSLFGRSESNDLISNYNDFMSNKGMRIFPVDMINNSNSKEIEIRMDYNRQQSRQSNSSKNYLIAYQMNRISKLKEKITQKDKIIRNKCDSINNMKNKIQKIDKEQKQYERWLEKEKEENENLIYLLNFLIECK